MKIKCPFGYNEMGYYTTCAKEECALWGEVEDTCLIRLALKRYIHDKNNKIEEKIADLEQRTQMAALLGFPVHPFGNKNWEGLQGGL